MKHTNMRRSVKWICTLIACTLLVGLIPLSVFASETVPFGNLALGKELTASSSYNDFYTPDKIVDGTKRRGGQFDYSRWNSQATKGEEWLVLNLGSVVPVGSVRIEWWDWQNLAGTITVLTSVDGTEYTQVGKVEGNFQVAFNHFAFDEVVEAQYIKIILNDCIGDWGYSILELDVYPNGENLAMGKTITASSTHELGYTTDRMIDGVKTEEFSRWNSVATAGEEWLIVDLEKIEAVQTVYMEWWDWVNIAGTVTVLTSVDGVEYKEIGKVEGNKEVSFNLFNLSEPVEARFVKIVFQNCVSEWGYSLSELEIYAANAPVEEECEHTGGKATCTDQAVCTECGESYGEVDADNHGETELKGAKEATETEPGYTGDKVCKDCGKTVETGTKIPATGTEVTPPPTGDTLAIVLMLSAVALVAMAMVGFRQRGKHSSH